MGEEPAVTGSALPIVSSSYPGPPLDNQQTQSQIPPEDNSTPLAQLSHGILQQGPIVSFDMAQPQGPVRQNPYNMGALANALPQANYRQGHFNPTPAQMRYNNVGPPPAVGQTQHMPQYGAAMGHMPNHSYYTQQQPHMQPYYGSPISPSQAQSNMAPRSTMQYYGNQVQQPHPSMGYYYAQMPHFAQQGQASHQGPPGSYMTVATAHDPRLGPNQLGDIGESGAFSPTHQELRRSPDDNQSNVVRGPPRKPRQSGHAIWIGNLPSQTELMNLVHHVCKEAEGLESLFLISKSNCAFANYKDEASCLNAQQKLHESKFQTVRLVSRLRKNTVEGASGVTAPTGPAATISQQPAVSEVKEIATTDSTEVKSVTSEPDAPSVTSPTTNAPVVTDATGRPDKFFILKSLTLEDLDLSVRTGIWATQSHNEEALNAAFKTSENVYLVFSANKSGEYYGYARMTSTINEDPAAAIEFAPKAQSVTDVDLPREIPTDATETTPKGRIIDDSARGTIFWEVVRDDLPDGQDQEEVASAITDQDDASSGIDSGLENKTWGKPFKLEWLGTNRLPFYRCRGLRNPWNSNREVKIARDGTELEPSVGQRLIGLFNRPSHNSPINRGPMVGMGQMMPPPQQIGMGYPPMYS
ncbi:hypothetical protein N0V82_008388 [Gnomoniopsis sp. IMI 355080]|nr:hypothetical protein N0V82_008388 [Gnomoniopsis sp. IMI 355080]